MVLQTPPAASAGYVNTASLGLVWQGFASGTGNFSALDYRVCLGTTPTGCQTLPFLPALSSGVATLAASDCGSTYFAAVRATNCAGSACPPILQGSTAATAGHRSHRHPDHRNCRRVASCLSSVASPDSAPLCDYYVIAM